MCQPVSEKWTKPGFAVLLETGRTLIVISEGSGKMMKVNRKITMPTAIRQLFILVAPGLLVGFALQGIACAAAAGVPCDYNNDGICDAADYVQWRNGGPLANEGVNPGVVNQADYEFWRVNFGMTAAAGSGTSAIVTPKPSTLLLAFAALAALSARRRQPASTKASCQS